jgi:hypothetical protein
MAMWWTQDGYRTLEGAEAQLFREMLAALVEDQVRAEACDDQWPIGIDVFDDLEYGQKLAMLEFVGRGLLVKDEPAPELTAVSEASLATVFEHLRQLIEMEIHFDSGHSWRSRLRPVLLQVIDEEVRDRIVGVESDDLDEWGMWIEMWRDRYLSDTDWERDLVGQDGSPEEVDERKKCLGIADDYYISIAPDPAPSQIPALLARLRQLTSERP